MDYTEQRKFLRSSRAWGAALVLVLFAAVAACIQIGKISDPKLLALYAAVTSALAVFIYYTPDYLHLSVDPAKRSRWAVKIRWRIIAAALILSALLASNTGERVTAAAAIIWLVVLNLFGRKVPRRLVPLYFWLGETALLAALLLIVRLDLLLATLLLAAAAHLAITVADRASLPLGRRGQRCGPAAGSHRGVAATRGCNLRSGIGLCAAGGVAGNSLSGPSRGCAQRGKRQSVHPRTERIYRLPCGAHSALVGGEQSGVGQRTGNRRRLLPMIATA